MNPLVPWGILFWVAVFGAVAVGLYVMRRDKVAAATAAWTKTELLVLLACALAIWIGSWLLFQGLRPTWNQWYIDVAGGLATSIIALVLSAVIIRRRRARKTMMTTSQIGGNTKPPTGPSQGIAPDLTAVYSKLSALEARLTALEGREVTSAPKDPWPFA